MVDLVPKVKRTDAIQAFVSQETPIVRITDDDGAVGTGYSYTIGTGGSSVVALLARPPRAAADRPRSRRIEEIWKALFFHTHATTVGAITSLALAAIDTALWDLRCRRAGLPLHVDGRRRADLGAALHDRGRLAAHRDRRRSSRTRSRAKARASAARKVKIGRPAGQEDVARLAAVREAVGDGLRDHDRRATRALAVDEAIRRARLYEPFDLAWIEEPLPAEDLDGHVRLAALRPRCRSPSANRSTACALPRISAARRAARIVQVDVRADRRHHAVAQGRASRRGLQRAGLPAFPDGAARLA